MFSAENIVVLGAGKSGVGAAVLAQKKGKNVFVCPIHEFWLDIGQPELLKKANDEWCSL